MGFFSKLFGKKETETPKESEVVQAQNSSFAKASPSEPAGTTPTTKATDTSTSTSTNTSTKTENQKTDLSIDKKTEKPDSKPVEKPATAPSGISAATPSGKQAEKPVAPVDKPTPPADKPTPPAKKPAPPADKPTPPAKKPAPPAVSTTITTPETATEKWIAASYAIDTVYSGGDWHYFGGCREANAQKQAEARLTLQNDWSVKDKASLMEMTEWLTSFYESEKCDSSDAKTGGWDLCRGCQILSLGYIAGYITKEEMVFSSVKICQTMQYWYHSWKELYESYVEGYHDWRGNLGGNIHGDVAQREKICTQLMQGKDNPTEISWGMKLTGTR